MTEDEIKKIDGLTLDLNFNLKVLNSAITNSDDNLEVCHLSFIIKKLLETSDKIREIFACSI